jgi:trans-AT polyketide synthase, acyltransferase and oxidoreductase domains
MSLGSRFHKRLMQPTQDPVTLATCSPRFDAAAIHAVAHAPRTPVLVVQDRATGAVGVQSASLEDPVAAQARAGADLVGALPSLYPEWLGDRSFSEVHGTRFAYVTGAMANGIATAELVIRAAEAGFLGFFGAAGLDPDRIERELDTLERALGARGLPWGSNLIHNPAEPAQEAAVADLCLRRGVTRVSAAAYMRLTPPLVRYAASGLTRAADGSVARRNFVFAKISHPSVATHFLRPAPAAMLDALVAQGLLTHEEATLARLVPVAEDITVESDSGGHTDNRPLLSLFPTITGLRDAIAAEQGYTRPIRVGAAGGLGTPEAVASAFALGAAYVLTGTVNQACVESGLSAAGRALLAEADLADVVMAPAADMFEMGVEVQVLQRGTMFGARAKKLYAFYRAYEGLDAIAPADRNTLEQTVLRATLDEAWASTRAYWEARDPREVARAEREPKHKMALVFRSYLGQSSRWAIAGTEDRRADYQIWCGPAMGAFNRWTRGSFLEAPESRTVTQVGLNLLEGAAVVARASQLRSFGAPVPASAFQTRPRRLA